MRLWSLANLEETKPFEVFHPSTNVACYESPYSTAIGLLKIESPKNAVGITIEHLDYYRFQCLQLYGSIGYIMFQKLFHRLSRSQHYKRYQREHQSPCHRHYYADLTEQGRVGALRHLPLAHSWITLLSFIPWPLMMVGNTITFNDRHCIIESSIGFLIKPKVAPWHPCVGGVGHVTTSSFPHIAKVTSTRNGYIWRLSESQHLPALSWREAHTIIVASVREQSYISTGCHPHRLLSCSCSLYQGIQRFCHFYGWSHANVIPILSSHTFIQKGIRYKRYV